MPTICKRAVFRLAGCRNIGKISIGYGGYSSLSHSYNSPPVKPLFKDVQGRSIFPVRLYSAFWQGIIRPENKSASDMERVSNAGQNLDSRGSICFARFKSLASRWLGTKFRNMVNHCCSSFNSASEKLVKGSAATKGIVKSLLEKSDLGIVQMPKKTSDVGESFARAIREMAPFHSPIWELLRRTSGISKPFPDKTEYGAMYFQLWIALVCLTPPLIEAAHASSNICSPNHPLSRVHGMFVVAIKVISTFSANAEESFWTKTRKAKFESPGSIGTNKKPGTECALSNSCTIRKSFVRTILFKPFAITENSKCALGTGVMGCGLFNDEI